MNNTLLHYLLFRRQLFIVKAPIYFKRIKQTPKKFTLVSCSKLPKKAYCSFGPILFEVYLGL